MSQSNHRIPRRTVLGFLAAAPVVLSARPSFGQQEPIKIGGIFPLTGGNSVFGNQNFQGVETAIDLINDRGGVKGRKIQLFKGDGNSPQAAISETNRLASREGVKIFVG